MRKIIVNILSIILSFVLFIPITVFADEIASYETGKSVKYRWNVKSGSIYTISVYNMLPSSYGAYRYVVTGTNNIKNQSPSNIGASYLGAGSYSPTSNVDVSRPDQETWNRLGLGGLALATTAPASNGNFYYNYASMPNSGTVYVNYALVMFHPSTNNMQQSEAISTVMHEFCHVFGMGHTANQNSILSASGVGSTRLGSFDISEFRRMYP